MNRQVLHSFVERVRLSGPAYFSHVDGRTVCPICGGGGGRSGRDRDGGIGVMTFDGIRFSCRSERCFTDADILEIAGLQFGVSSQLEKLRIAADRVGLPIPAGYPHSNIP